MIQVPHSSWGVLIILVKKYCVSCRLYVEYHSLNASTRSMCVFYQYSTTLLTDSTRLCAFFLWTYDPDTGRYLFVSATKKRPLRHTGRNMRIHYLNGGLCNAPVILERSMDTVLQGTKRDVCMCYLDDVIIGRTFHVQNARPAVVLARIQKAGPILKY